MQIKNGVIPEFYQKYVQYVQKKINTNAKLEFGNIIFNSQRMFVA
jgi:hypothetical protein